jgi:hypothetical protein
LVTTAHPHRPDFGIGVDIDFVLKHRDLVGRQRGQELAQGVQLGLPLGVSGTDYGARPAPHQLCSMQPAPHAFGTNLHS